MDQLLQLVEDIPLPDRRSLERLLCRTLRDDEHMLIHVVAGDVATPDSDEAVALLPDWCAVYEGLSPQEAGKIERSIFNRADLSRSFE